MKGELKVIMERVRYKTKRGTRALFKENLRRRAAIKMSVAGITARNKKRRERTA